VSAEEKRALVRRAIEEIYTKRNPEAIDDIYAPDYVFHGSAAHPELRGLEGVKRFVEASREAFHEVDMSVEDQLVERDKVVNPLEGARHPQKRGCCRRSPYR
jgi:hypothetical protein